jgi:glutamyl-tRNA reductase
MIGVIGTSYRCADLSIREAIAKAIASCDCAFMDRSIALLTCNRAEWYFSTHNTAHTHQKIISYIKAHAGDEAVCHLYTFLGLECFWHLGRVVAGLDSLFIGETEIQGQVKAAYEEARAQKSLPSELHFLFQRSLRTGKVLRKSLPSPSGNGLCEQVSRLVVDHLCDADNSSVLLVGASMVNRRLAKMLQEKDVHVTYTNRTFERAQEAAGEIGGQALPWTELLSAWPSFPCVVAATRSSEYVLQKAARGSPLFPQLLVDLGVPRNIDPALAADGRRVVFIDVFTPTCKAEDTLAFRSKNDYAACSRRPEGFYAG